MPRVAPFEALVYDTEVAGPLEDVTARPYDVISEAGRRSYRARSPHNIVRLDLASDPTAPPGARHAGARNLLASWLHGGILRTLPTGYVAYEMAAPDSPPVRGFFCALTLEPWGGSILPHEDVMEGPVADRLESLEATRTNLSAIYGTVAGPHAAMADALTRIAATRPAGEVSDEEGVRHRTWPLPATTPVDRWLAEDHLLIADGHHRYTTALAYRERRRHADGPGPWDRVLALVVDAGTNRVPVLPYHRIQRSGAPLPDGTPATDRHEVLAGLNDDAVRVGSLTLGADGGPRWGLHDLRGDPPAVRALHEAFLDGLPPDALAFTHDADEATAAVLEGGSVAAYLLPPTDPARIMKVVESGQRLPRKSTFFWPKPRTGMVMMSLDRVTPPAPPPSV